MPMERKRIMRALALSDADRLIESMGTLGQLPAFIYLRRPQKGLIMAKARADATGAPFNLGEVLVTRCSLSVKGLIGHAYVLGDAPEKCLAAALADALGQDDAYGPAIEDMVLSLEEELARKRANENERTQKTKVEFFTLVRGEDEN
ncbi:MAG: phosphonate C-P lyase system protein PhnG [Deltaproteobacteria bacterium]|jgi:alpha-D-ribose 1-methylphosphonate 5-triphosphate synthase subunit PhnG|nr:phosphonate C-P lyase system protein PhnG [Deltaproteobacteria bacterium]